MISKGLKKCLAVLLVATTLVGCGSNGATTSSDTKNDVKNDTNTNQQVSDDTVKDDNMKPYEGVVVKYATSETAAEGAENLALVEMVKEKTGIEIEFTIIPNTNAGEVDKALISLLAGDSFDILYGTNQKLKTYYNANLLTPMDEMAKSTSYDMEGIYGDSLAIYDDGNTYALPAFNDIWLTFYNKKIFDEAGVSYPSAEGWTWEKYIETAKLLTQADKDVWGSFMLDYDNYNYMYALQKGANPYKEDGTANFDDPLFAEGLQFFYDLGNVEKIQPDSLTYASGAYPWNTYVASGNMGMFVCGGWVSSMLNNTEKYPRDWECGILPMPYPEGSEPSSLVVTGSYAIPTTSKNKEAAFEVIKCIAENQYTLGYGRVPARVDLTEEEISQYITTNLVPSYTLDNITEEDFRAGWFDVDRKIVSEKVIGTADTVISQIWIEEGQMYGQGLLSLEDAIKNIQERSNTAIEEELAN